MAADFQPTFSKGDRVEILVSTGFGLITGRIIEQLVDWWVVDPTSEGQRKQPGSKRRPVRWIQVRHIVAVSKTEEQ